MKVVRRYGIETLFNPNLVAVDGARKVAIFEKTDDPAKPRVEIPYAFMQVTPPQRAPDFGIDRATGSGAARLIAQPLELPRRDRGVSDPRRGLALFGG